MLRYISLSVFALLLLTACGDGLTDQVGGQETVTDTSSQDFIKDHIGKDLGHLEKQSSPKICRGCDLVNANLSEANLSGARLQGANLTGSDLTAADLSGAYLTDAILTDAILDGVTGAEFTGALNVPDQYIKDLG